MSLSAHSILSILDIIQSLHVSNTTHSLASKRSLRNIYSDEFLPNSIVKTGYSRFSPVAQAERRKGKVINIKDNFLINFIVILVFAAKLHQLLIICKKNR